ncbi:MAG: ribosome silencing factor [Nitrospinota bacterium]
MITKNNKDIVSSEKKLAICYEALNDKKGFDIVAKDLRGYTDIADFFLIASANSTIQASILIDAVEAKLRLLNVKEYHIEGRANGRWILLDGSDIVIHVFLKEARDYYDLDSHWLEVKDCDISNLDSNG